MLDYAREPCAWPHIAYPPGIRYRPITVIIFGLFIREIRGKSDRPVPLTFFQFGWSREVSTEAGGYTKDRGLLFFSI